MWKLENLNLVEFFRVDDIIYLSNYEKGCIDAALRAHNEDKLIEIEESMGGIVNV
jgi:hypothetical protein